MPAYRQAAETNALCSCKILITANPLTGKGFKEFCSCSFRGSTWFAYTCVSPIACMKSPGRSPQTYRNNTSIFVYVEQFCAIQAGYLLTSKTYSTVCSHKTRASDKMQTCSQSDVSGAFDTIFLCESGSLPTRGTVSSSHLMPSHLCNEACQQGITGYIEGHTQTQITAALVHLTRQLPICHIELQHRCACDEHAKQCSKEKKERKGCKFSEKTIRKMREQNDSHACRQRSSRLWQLVTGRQPACDQRGRLTWQNMWQGGRAISGSAAGFHAVKTMRRSSGLFLILSMTCVQQCGHQAAVQQLQCLQRFLSTFQGMHA